MKLCSSTCLCACLMPLAYYIDEGEGGGEGRGGEGREGRGGEGRGGGRTQCEPTLIVPFFLRPVRMSNRVVLPQPGGRERACAVMCKHSLQGNTKAHGDDGGNMCHSTMQ